jgi:hypothetical protein
MLFCYLNEHPLSSVVTPIPNPSTLFLLNISAYKDSHTIKLKLGGVVEILI